MGNTTMKSREGKLDARDAGGLEGVVCPISRQDDPLFRGPGEGNGRCDPFDGYGGSADPFPGNRKPIKDD